MGWKIGLLVFIAILMAGYSYSYQTSGKYWSQDDMPVQYETVSSIPSS